ncbi:MAG: allophanate hydrolase subunit 1 [Gammaproteobacteria bacterium]|nr:allophanate hydrolase subunit 1 [Gammaproteobacteria bacterium]MDH5304941.1 allophanate hydrolase subunit 1 [Gammaproteobacteria bacterium]MDH5321721.1 allophanate hydrolase subunit 1 [Gammaproteobacteria bacterium]
MLRINICGDDLLSIDIDGRSKRASIAQHLRDSGVWIECVEGMACVVVQFDSAVFTTVEAERILMSQLPSASRRKLDKSSRIEIPVCYGGEFGTEFDSICEMINISADELVHIHTSREHRVVLIGFTPGFAYLEGLDDDLRIPRLTEPRQHVAAGSVGVAAGLTGLYATAGPAGWPLLGRTPMPLLLPGAMQPFVLQVGMRVRFTAIDAKTFRELAAR